MIGALVRAGIKNFRWHDLRHTWREHRFTCCRSLGGWESVEMVRRYAHLSSVHLTEYVDRASPLRLAASDGTAIFRLHNRG